MDTRPEPVTGPAAGSNAVAKTSNWMAYREAVRSCIRVLPGCLAGLAAVALVTCCGFRLHLNLSTSGSRYFLIVVMVSVVWPRAL